MELKLLLSNVMMEIIYLEIVVSIVNLKVAQQSAELQWEYVMLQIIVLEIVPFALPMPNQHQNADQLMALAINLNSVME